MAWKKIAALLLLLLGIAILVRSNLGCRISNPAQAEVDYSIGYLENGVPRLVDTSMEDEAVRFGIYSPFRPYRPIKASDLPLNISSNLIGLEKGDIVVGVLPPGEGFPERNESMVIAVPNSILPRKGLVGEPATIGNLQGVVVAANDSHTVIDLNPPFAGKQLLYKVIIRDVKCII